MILAFLILFLWPQICFPGLCFPCLFQIEEDFDSTCNNILDFSTQNVFYNTRIFNENVSCCKPLIYHKFYCFFEYGAWYLLNCTPFLWNYIRNFRDLNIFSLATYSIETVTVYCISKINLSKIQVIDSKLFLYHQYKAKLENQELRCWFHLVNRQICRDSL